MDNIWSKILYKKEVPVFENVGKNEILLSDYKKYKTLLNLAIRQAKHLYYLKSRSDLMEI